MLIVCACVEILLLGNFSHLAAAIFVCKLKHAEVRWEFLHYQSRGAGYPCKCQSTEEACFGY